MRILLLSIFLIASKIAVSQEMKNVERLWLNANHGFNHYNEIGGQVQFFKQLLVAGYVQSFKEKAGPGLATNPMALLWSPHTYKWNKVNSGSLLIGFASPTPNAVYISFLAGPSINRNEIHTNVHIAQTVLGKKYLSSTFTESWSVGVDYKVTLGIRVHNGISLNFGLAGNCSRLQQYNRFVIGLGVGSFGWDRTRTSPTGEI